MSEPPGMSGATLVAPRRRATWSGVAAPLAVLVVVVVAWQVISGAILSRGAAFLLPPPDRVVRSALLDADNRAELLGAVGTTVVVAVTGFALATTIGMAIAVLMHQSPWIHRAVYPYLVLVDTVPTLAIVPLVGFSLGYGFRSQVLVCVLVGLFPVINNATLGFRSIDTGVVDLFRLRRCSRWARLVKLDLPGALPQIATGLRISAPLAVIAAVVSGFFFRSGEPGIGRLIFLYRRNLSSELLIAAVVAAAVLGLVFLAAINAALATALRTRSSPSPTDRWEPTAPQHHDWSST